ncbi:CE1759 family FMN reductase [Streptomyces polyrhachis]|uniref:CE1759 family FMN reductase n=1 Tax=Streptomyces polyrhachis TaxID=1282885 RepID=A0ABW2GPX5_9ACTN
MMKLAVVSGGLREPSSTRLLADRLLAATVRDLARDGTDTESAIVELRPLAHPLMDAMLTGFASGPLEEAFTAVAEADGLIVVTPAFNASYSGLFKSFFDVLPVGSLADTPVLIGATGGTERHTLVLEHALRPLFSYLHAIVSPRSVYAATSDFGSTTDSGGALDKRIDAAASDFARVLRSCGPQARRSAAGAAEEEGGPVTGATPEEADLATMRRLLGGAD